MLNHSKDCINFPQIEFNYSFIKHRNFRWKGLSTIAWVFWHPNCAYPISSFLHFLLKSICHWELNEEVNMIQCLSLNNHIRLLNASQRLLAVLKKERKKQLTSTARGKRLLQTWRDPNENKTFPSTRKTSFLLKMHWNPENSCQLYF